MKVLMVHNRYQQRGGEDAVVDAEVRLLVANGIEVQRLEVDNDSIHGLRGKMRTSMNLFVASSAMTEELRSIMAEFRPDVVHVHNWFPTVSPFIFRRCKQAEIPVVHTLHNYRLLCVNATLFRDGRVCEDCIGSALRAPGVIHKCYRDSRAGSFVATASMVAQWAAGTWHHSIDKFIVLSEFARIKLVQGGLPAEKIVVKPNFVDPDPGPASGDGNYFLYAGRLTEEKGLRTLLQCWRNGHGLPLLRIVGLGPLEDEVREAAAVLSNVEWMGGKSNEEVAQLLGRAKATLCPSLWYEGMPRVVIESMAAGTPVVASRIGCYPEMIVDGQSGALFAAGDAGSLLDCLRSLEVAGAFAAMRPQARRRYEEAYTGERNFSLLLNVYRGAMVAGSRVYPIPVAT
ncbi:MAG: glycosyltransferase family 4 protein [Terracidiphilus sp.]|jgi:glycosyltransferase involved in cell wall biosynthesis